MKKSKRGKASKVDMISNLPDPIIQLILSRLPTTEEVHRTSILSRRWRNLWTSVPSIDIDFSRRLNPSEEFNKNKFEEFVCRVLEINSLDLDSVCLSCDHPYDMSTVGRWIEAAVRRNVKLLDLSFSLINEHEVIELPLCLVTCSSLEVLRLSLFAACLSLPKVTGFPALRVLELNSCKLFNNNLVRDFLKSLTLLEDLSLLDCKIYDPNLFSISCPKLKNLRIDYRKTRRFTFGDSGIEGLFNCIEICCPKLVFLEIAGFMANEIILESFDSLKKAVIRMCTFLKGINLEHLPAKSLPNLKTLELTTTTVDAYNMAVVLMQILIRSPNLESLHFIIQMGQYSTSDDDFEFWDENEMEHDCRFERLKMVNLKGLSAVPNHMRFIEILLESSPCLETMSITLSEKMTSDTKLRFTIDLLGFQRASPEAEIIFVQDQV